MGILLALLLPYAVHGIDSVYVQVQIQDTERNLTPARVHVLDSYNHPYPGVFDSTLMAHGHLYSYFYTEGTFEAYVPTGYTDIVAGRGFEWEPAQIRPFVTSDTSFVITLEKIFDMRGQGWYSGDTQAHIRHEPLDYDISPEELHLMAQCEDLQQTWCLDNHYLFTGAEHAVSTPENSIYFSVEYRHNSLGHVALLGLKEIFGVSCCWLPEPAFPTLCDIREEWDPQWDESMGLLHPHNGSGFFDDDGWWPSNGLARELPVMAALGHLDHLDIAAYSNVPFIYIDDWYHLLNCGLHIPPSAGTDGVTNMYWSYPIGGFKVYVKEVPPEDPDPAKWVSALKHGRSFVTNYPLIPNFTVNGVGMGGELKLFHPDTLVDVELRVESVLPIQTVSIIRNGNVEVEIPITSHIGSVVVDTTVQVPLEESSWLAVRVYGQTDLRHAVGPELFAHTGAIYVNLDSALVRSYEGSSHFLNWIDSTETFVEIRDNWGSPADRFQVLQRLEQGREYYRDVFVVPPEPFELLRPTQGETLWTNYPELLSWTESVDIEPYDSVIYRVEIASDSLFEKVFPMLPTTETEQEVTISYSPDNHLWVRVVATDQGGNKTTSTPDTVKVFMTYAPADVDDGITEDTIEIPVRTHLKVWPNPADGQVWFRLFPPKAEPSRIEIVNVLGRRIATNHTQGKAGSAIRKTGTNLFIWDGRDESGHLVPSGHYWIRVLSSIDVKTGKQTVAPVLILR